MIRFIFKILGCFTSFSSSSKKSEVVLDLSVSGNSLHQFSVKDIRGNLFSFKSLQGKKVLIVNTASKCGLTPQYEQLQELYLRYKNKNFEIIGFPSNDFLWQEPGSNSEIEQFCSLNYGVTFPIMDKVSVKGNAIHDVYQFLTKKSMNKVMDSSVSWNFQKYLLDENGVLVKMIDPKTLPTSPEIVNWIEGNS